MEKLTIYATGNERVKGDYNVSYYIIEKNKLFLDWLGALLEEVMGLEDGKFRAKFWVREQENEKGEIIGEEVIEKKPHKMKDIHENYTSGGNRIDIFYGDKRAYLTFRKNREAREKLAKFMIKKVKGINVEEKILSNLDKIVSGK